MALNTSDWDRAWSIVDDLRNDVDMFKVGLPLYTGRGYREVERMVEEGLKVFLDLKLYDIPSVVVKTIQELPPVEIVTVHALGGTNMMEAAIGARRDIKIAAVTVLTSISDEWVSAIFRKNLRGVLVYLSRAAAEGGAWGVVVSGKEARYIRKNFKSLNLVIPGVRVSRGKDDHERVVNVKNLRWLGEQDIVVIGREITESLNPREVIGKVRRILGIR